MLIGYDPGGESFTVEMFVRNAIREHLARVVYIEWTRMHQRMSRKINIDNRFLKAMSRRSEGPNARIGVRQRAYLQRCRERNYLIDRCRLMAEELASASGD